MKNNIRRNPIGVFDSGVGGLTVVREICNVLPNEDIIYLGDTARLPYGSKSENTIKQYSLENTIFLHSKNVKIIVIACNTASAVSLAYLKSIIRTPVIGVVECGALGAVKRTRGKRIGVIGTKATINSKAYSKAIKKFDPKIKVFEVATPLLVNLVEEYWVEKKITDEILREYLMPLYEKKIDTLILGCTHFPLLADRIREISQAINIVDSSKETSKLIFTTLAQENTITTKETPGKIKAYLTDSHPNFKKFAKKLFKSENTLEIYRA